jgi:signal transduction histidine kinase
MFDVTLARERHLMGIRALENWSQSAMRATETHFHCLADSLPQLVWVVDADGRISYGNSSWYALMSIGAGTQFLDSYLPALHPADRSVWERTWEHAVASGEPYSVERRIRLSPEADYVRQLEWGNPIRDDSGKNGDWMIIATDADENERRIAQLRRAVERKDRFLALVAHELRGPLAPISSALQLLALHMDEPLVVKQSSATLARQVTQLVRLVDDLFDLARSQSAQVLLRSGSLELEAAVTAAVEAAQPIIASRGHQLTIVTPPDTTTLAGDAGRLTQVFANLLVNAAKFTDNGGRISVSIEQEPDWAVVKVRDSGIGIPRDMLERVFDAYVQAERGSAASKSGLGLGLALARHLVQLHGGTIMAYSDGPGRGSEFVVRLPVPRGQHCPAGYPANAHSSYVLT